MPTTKPAAKPLTPGYSLHLEIALTSTASGPVAYRWSPQGFRWIRMSRNAAEIFIAAGAATQVDYTGSAAARFAR